MWLIQNEKRQCDAKCYNAKKSECNCCCNGINHGKGFLQAIAITKFYADLNVKWFRKRCGKINFDAIHQQILDLI